MKKPFRPTERVRIYSQATPVTGEIVAVYVTNDLLKIAIPSEGPNCQYVYRHKKQCRRLVKKEMRKMRLHFMSNGSYAGHAHYDTGRGACANAVDNCVEFIEVKPK